MRKGTDSSVPNGAFPDNFQALSRGERVDAQAAG
jgi:hypothetical protein